MRQQVRQCEQDARLDLLGYIDEAITAKLAEQCQTIQRQIEQALTQSRQAGRSALANRATIVAFSGDMDKLIAAFIIATGAAAMGMEVSMFFTFWGLAALKKKTVLKGKTIPEKLMGLMLPSRPAQLATSKMNMLGVGPAFFKHVMKQKNIQSLPGLIEMARDAHVRMVACRTSMDMMGISKEELIEGVEYGGVATYLSDARDSRITLFI